MKPTSGSTDNDLFELFKKGDEKAFERIFKLSYNRVTGFCNLFINDKDKAKSLSQEAFIHLWLNREKIDTINGIPAFLYTFAKSGCLNYIRHEKNVLKYKEKYLQETEGRLNQEILESTNFNQLEFTELQKIIQDTIQELPDQCRKVFLLRRIEGKKNREIADELGITVKAVEANMTRALKLLRKNLSAYLPAILVQIILNFF